MQHWKVVAGGGTKLVAEPLVSPPRSKKPKGREEIDPNHKRQNG